MANVGGGGLGGEGGEDCTWAYPPANIDTEKRKYDYMYHPETYKTQHCDKVHTPELCIHTIMNNVLLPLVFEAEYVTSFLLIRPIASSSPSPSSAPLSITARYE